MKAARSFVTTIAASAFAASLAVTVTAQEATPDQSGDENIDRAIQTSVERAEPVTIVAAGRTAEGVRLDSETLNKQFRQVMRSYVDQRIDFRLDGFYPTGILVLYERPERDAISKASLGMTVPSGGGYEMSGGLEQLDFDFKKAVRYVHVGPFEQLGEIYDRIAEQSKEQGVELGFPVVLQILDDPVETRPENLRTVMNIPLM